MRRAGGSKARQKQPPGVHAVRPGMIGGRYQPLTPAEVNRVHGAVLEVLEQIGMGSPIPILREKAVEAGCWMDDDDRLHFPRGLVEDVIARAGREAVFYAHDPKYDLDLGGERVHTYGGGEAVTVLEPGGKDFRPSTLLDVYDFARLVDCMENIHAFSRLVVATELEDLRLCDINTAYASVTGTRKHSALTFAYAAHIEPTLEMLYLMAGGKKKFHERPFAHGGGCCVLSPLRYGRSNSEVCVESIKFGAPVWIVTAPQAGATAPAALAGALVQVVAEALAGLLLVDLVQPGHPVILGPWPFISDLRTGSFSGGSGEEALASAAAAQMINHYGLISSVGAGMTDAKIPDAQAGYEKGITVTLAALAGCNNVSESAGFLGSLMACSYEAMVIDNDMLGNVLRTVRGIEINEDTLSVEVIREVVAGEGHYLRHQQTLDLMRSEYHYPGLADRRSPKEWLAEGAPDIREVAAGRARAILAEHYPQIVEPAIDRKIRDSFPIVLPEQAMRPGNGRW